MVDVAESQYMFVEYAATTRPSQGEKRRRGGPTEVRSHITKAFHRRTKITRLEASTRVPATPELKPQTSTGAAKGDDDAAQIGRSLSSDKDAKTGVARNRCSSKDGSVQYYTDQQSNTVLRDGGFNAFDLLTGQRMPQYIHLVLDHALQISWPNTIPIKSKAVINPVQRPLIRLSHKTETIKLVNQQLRSLDGPASDALIMAVAILAIHGSRDETVHPEVHPPSPLASAQNVHVYGNMINDEQHTQAILVLIEQKGGLESLELFGMADIMALCDLYFATKHIRRPAFPLRRPSVSLVLSGRHVLDSRAIELDSELGTGFRYFRSNSTGYELLEVLESFSEVTNALDHYARGGSAAPELVDLIEARNASQHRLLSLLPKRVDLTDAEVCVQQATRLATMIFSDMVLFPLPPTQRMRPKLARELVDILEACTLLRCWDVHGQVLVWILTLGTVAASFTPERTWYVEQLSYRLSVMSIDDLPELESICSKFLWWQPICGGPVQTLWYEVQLEFQAAESLPD
ncbi:hypothetical protein LTR13_007549 [Exophiala sideris]|uniref:Transcription factor domain-containing protein n=1 Tax=Exophiala sideris TaxID=1016849 RepID=A0ABR0J857_9EURO|nr:hypothetical protein LTR13_007549 [Exophiala sideris]KAK5058237.1 hypothetical protein LTR69_006641 [Exophiala sideris]KAK5180167.1 hypothetical protein LTR44_007292 [Eurotiomycetes sp. CCFEE 6388]